MGSRGQGLAKGYLTAGGFPETQVQGGTGIIEWSRALVSGVPKPECRKAPGMAQRGGIWLSRRSVRYRRYC